MIDRESLNEALVDCIKATGNSKEYGAMLWPEKPVKDSQNLLLACLNDLRPEKLTPDQAMLIARTAKQRGCHIYMEFIAESLGYLKPVAINKEDEKATLQREFIEAQKNMAALAKRMESVGLLKAVA